MGLSDRRDKMRQLKGHLDHLEKMHDPLKTLSDSETNSELSETGSTSSFETNRMPSPTKAGGTSGSLAGRSGSGR